MKADVLKKKIESVGKAVLRAVPVGERVFSFKDTVTEPGKGYTLSRMYDLGGETVTLPRGVVLAFKPGAGLKNGRIVGDGAIIKADSRIFYDVEVDGSWACRGNALWWTDGCQLSETDKGVPFISKYVDDYKGLQAALDSSFTEIVFSPRLYYTTQTLLLWNEKKLTFEGVRMGNSLSNCPKAIRNAAILFTDKSIVVVRVAVGGTTGHESVAIVGGNFDVSLCPEYTASVIEVRTDRNERLWGLTIETNIRAAYGNRHGIGVDINPVENKASTGYVTEVRINSCVANFCIGVRAQGYHDEGLTPYNWCSDVVIDGSVINCPVCVQMDCDGDVRAMLQSGKFFGVKDNGVGLVRINTPYTCTVSSNVYDIRQGSGESFSNEYAIDVAPGSGTVTASGKFCAFCIACQRLGWEIIKGKVEI